MHSLQIPNSKVAFHYNSDLSGPIHISDKEDEVCIEFEDLMSFVAHVAIDRVRSLVDDLDPFKIGKGLVSVFTGEVFNGFR